MGLAASQARLLTITARLADNELRSQTINNAKMRLATQSSQASDDYISALNNAQLMFSNTDITGLARTQSLTYNNLVSYSQYNNQYGLVNSAGLLLVSEQDAAIYEASGGDLNKFLEGYGLEWNTTFFNSTDDYDSALSTGGLQSTLVQFYGNSNTGTAATPRWDYGKLFEGMTNEELKKLYEYGTSDEASIEKLNYNNIAQAYYNEVKDAYTNAIPLLRNMLLGDSTSADKEEEIAQALAALAENAGAGDGDRLLKAELLNDSGFGYDCSKFNYNVIKKFLTGDETNLLPGTGKYYLTSLIESLTDRTVDGTELAGFMDVTLTGPSTGSGTFTYDKRKTPSGVPHSASEVYETVTPTGCPYQTISFGGLTFGVQMPVTTSDGTVSWYDKDDTTVLGTHSVERDTGARITQILGSATDGQGATITSVGAINGMVANWTIDDFNNPANKKLLADAMEAVLDHKDPATGDSTGPLPCVYRYIDATGAIVRIPVKYVRNRADSGSSGMSSAYVALVHEYFDSILNHEGFINLSALTGDSTLSTQPGLANYNKAISDFKQYDSDPVLKDDAGNPYHAGDNNALEELCKKSPGLLLNFKGLLERKADIINTEIRAFLQNPNFDPTFGSEAFRSVILAYMAELMTDVLGEPKYAWVDANDPNSTQNADAKAQWYENLFNRMQRGYKVLENGLANSKEWIEYAFESGLVTMEQVDKSFNWIALDYKTCANIYEESDTSDLVAKAEAKYNRAMNDIKQKDNMYDLQLKNIDTEHSALQTEYDSVKGVIGKNLDRTMKFDQSA